MESEKPQEKQEEDGGECAAMETGGGGRSQEEGVMDNVKCHKRGWGWGGQEADESKPEPSNSVSCMVLETPQAKFQVSTLKLSTYMS